MNGIALPGLDGSTLLGFVGGLGVLEALWYTCLPSKPEPHLGWRRSGTWQPVVTGASSLDEITARVLDDARSALVESVLAFRYVKVEKNGPKEVQSLAAPVAVLRASLASHLAGDWRTADTLASLMCECAAEAMGNKAPSPDDLVGAGIEYDRHVPLNWTAAPTPFDFTSRNTQFLDQVRRVRDALSTDVILSDLSSGIGSASERIMRWDALVDMPGALFERVKPMRRPAAEWLVFRGIALFTLFAESANAGMAGLSGRRKAGEFSWVLWDRPLTRDVIKTVLALRWCAMGRTERMARGAATGFSVSLRKDATGYDGAVSPSRPLDDLRKRAEMSNRGPKLNQRDSQVSDADETL